MSDAISRVTRAILDAGGQAIAGYVTAGFPDLDRFPAILESVASRADVVEIGVTFSDPMADGLTIQQASHVALEAGVTLEWIFQIVSELELKAPHVLMGYYNPFLAFGLERLADRMTEVGTSGLIVPDLPLEESGVLAGHLEERGLGLIQLVAPTTPPGRAGAASPPAAGAFCGGSRSWRMRAADSSTRSRPRGRPGARSPSTRGYWPTWIESKRCRSSRFSPDSEFVSNHSSPNWQGMSMV